MFPVIIRDLTGSPVWVVLSDHPALQVIGIPCIFLIVLVCDLRDASPVVTGIPCEPPAILVHTYQVVILIGICDCPAQCIL